MEKELMPLAKFKTIMETIIELVEKRDRISDFLEKEVCTDSWCFVTVGSELETTLMNLLADEFECWYSTKETPEEYDWWNKEADPYRGFENDIENYIYMVPDRPYEIKIREKEYHIQSIEELYDFLVEQYKFNHSEDLTQV